MNPLARLFAKTPSASDIQLQLKQLERDQLKSRRGLEVLDQAKKAKVEAAVAAKKAGKQELVQDLFRDIRQIEIDHGHLNSELRRLSLSRTALTAFLRKLEMLEKNKDRKSLQNLIRRYNSSSIQEVIDKAEVDDETFGDLLQEILVETELAATPNKLQEDPGFAEFDRTIEEMAETAESGVQETPALAAPPRVEVKVRPGHMPQAMSENKEDLENAIRVMQQQIEMLNQKIEEAKRNLAELRAQAAELKAQGESKNRELRDKQRELEVLIAKGEFEETMLEALRTLISKILEETKDLKQQEDETNRKADELERYIDSREREVQDKQQQIAYLQSQLA
jgi:hypothetical protein